MQALTKRNQLISLRQIVEPFKPALYVLMCSLLHFADRLTVLQPEAAIPPEIQRLCPMYLASMAEELETLGLPNTLAQVRRTNSFMGMYTVGSLAGNLNEIQNRLVDELETNLFLHVSFKESGYYQEPLNDWEEVIRRFPDTRLDISEASKCFALDRYAACVFHCIQVLEQGMIALGDFMGAKDHKRGFDATRNELKRVVALKYADRSDLQRANYDFFVQVNGILEPLMEAWRHKINHVDGRPILMTADFSPQIAEEIMIAIRGIMRRLATDLPP